MDVEYEAMRSRRQRQLTRGRIRRVGLLERLRLTAAGYTDGKAGLPRRDEQGKWYSAFAHREKNSYEEFCAQAWAQLQMENEGLYARVEELLIRIPMLQNQLCQAADALDEAVQAERLTARRRGEEQLSEDQVRLRRTREWERGLSPLQLRHSELQVQLAEDSREFILLRQRLREDANTVCLAICRMQERMLQRLDIYWNAALRCHPDAARMPAIPEASLDNPAEQTYAALHSDLMHRADRLLPTQIAEPEAA